MSTGYRKLLTILTSLLYMIFRCSFSSQLLWDIGASTSRIHLPGNSCFGLKTENSVKYSYCRFALQMRLLFVVTDESPGAKSHVELPHIHWLFCELMAEHHADFVTWTQWLRKISTAIDTRATSTFALCDFVCLNLRPVYLCEIYVLFLLLSEWIYKS